MDLKARSTETDLALDNVLASLGTYGFTAPFVEADRNRDALAGALIHAAIEHELRIRIDRTHRTNRA